MIFKLLCPMCKINDILYTSSAGYEYGKNNPNSKCKQCRNIKERKCPSCGNLIKYKTIPGYHEGLKHNHKCKSCVNKHRFLQKNNQKWRLIVGNLVIIGLTQNRRNRILYYWKTLTENEKTIILNKTDLQKKYFWDHLKRAAKVKWHKNLKKAFEKYRGNNHWVKNPVVYNKIIESCKKYRGEGHWFNRNKI